MDFPRHVHKADRQYLRVDSPEEFTAALADGWQATPVWTAQELADRRAARIAAGEPPDDPAPEPKPVAKRK